jgi:hypothetical protein
MEKTLRGKTFNDLLEFVSSLGLAALALMGMAGVTYNALAPDGLMWPWLARLWANHPGFAVLVLIGLATMVLAARSPAASHRKADGNSDLALYVFVALGILFAARLFIYGTL